MAGLAVLPVTTVGSWPRPAALLRAQREKRALDEPVLTELVFTQAQTRTFMCAALAARQDPAEELAFAVQLINRVLEALHVDQLVLEYATERAGELLPVPGKELGLGVVNPRLPRVESHAEVRTRVEAALEHYAPERLFLNPDCGFATFSARPVNSRAIAFKKLKTLVEVARELRQSSSAAS